MQTQEAEETVMAAPIRKVYREKRGRYSSDKAKMYSRKDNVSRRREEKNILIDHNYPIGLIHDYEDTCEACCPEFPAWRNLQILRLWIGGKFDVLLS
jgi:hypothetical protein